MVIFLRNVLKLFWKPSDLAESGRETRLSYYHPPDRLSLVNRRTTLDIFLLLLSLDQFSVRNRHHCRLDGVDDDCLFFFFTVTRCKLQKRKYFTLYLRLYNSVAATATSAYKKLSVSVF